MQFQSLKYGGGNYVQHFRGTVSLMLGDPVCRDPACGYPVCRDPVCRDPACGDPTCRDPACGGSTLGNLAGANGVQC